MTIKPSGSSLSMFEINAEFGLGNDLNVYRGITWYTDDGVSGIFDTNNIDFNEFYSKRKDSPFFNVIKGFFLGGQISGSPYTVVATADRTTHSTETTAAVSGANYTGPREESAGEANTEKGFSSGGYSTTGGAYTISSEKTTFSTETTVAAPGANLSSGRRQLAASGNLIKSFYSGGITAIVISSNIADRNTYSTETMAAVSGANLTQVRSSPASSGNQDKGFFMGGAWYGDPTLWRSTADRTTYSTETTAAASSANLSAGRSGLVGAGDLTKGFFSGGFNGSVYVATADRTTYSTETTAAVSGANLTQARAAHGGITNGTKGFFSGGFNGSAYVATADRTTYSTETTAAVSGANLTQARADITGLS